MSSPLPIPHAARVCWMAVAAALLGIVKPGVTLAQAPTAPVPAPEQPIPMADFEKDTYAVFDPFFPNSKRHIPDIAPPPVAGRQPVVVPVNPLKHLRLKGIIGSEKRRVALLNNQTVMQGDLVDVRTPEGIVKIRCLKILAGSMIIKLGNEPEPRELLLPSAL